MSLLDGTPTPRMDLMVQASGFGCEGEGEVVKSAEIRARDSPGA
jgi:hypothetical protein